MSARPIHEVFHQRAQRIGFVLKNRIGRFHGWNPKGERPCMCLSVMATLVPS